MTAFTTDITVTLSDLQAVGGSGVDPASFDSASPQAISTIETITGVFFTAIYREGELSVGDAAWLKKAALYQIMFVLENPDVLSRTAVSSISQDGLSMSATDGLTFVLAPLAKRALNNCSWAKSGTVRVSPASATVELGAVVSDNHPWYPLGAV